MSLLIIGGTGTLGRQIVRRALDEGYKVKCLVRNLRKSYFLKEWGAELVYGDLSIPETIPLALKDVSAIIDASTARPSDPYNADRIDLTGKLALIDAAKLINIERFIFFSVLNSKLHSSVPLVNLKLQVEDHLVKSKVPYTIFYLTGFFQGLINQYAIPILEKQPIWITKEVGSIGYIDTQDVAKFALRSLNLESARSNTFPLVGPKAWTSEEIIKLCERLSGQSAVLTNLPLPFLQTLRTLTSFFEWGKNISDRLAFAEILVADPNLRSDMTETCNLFSIDIEELSSLERYMQDYFGRIRAICSWSKA